LKEIPFLLKSLEHEILLFRNLLVFWNQSSLTKARVRHSRESGNPGGFEFPGFRVALPPEADQHKAEAVASLPGMTIELCNELQKHHTQCHIPCQLTT
jgi:hypothetical protein